MQVRVTRRSPEAALPGPTAPARRDGGVRSAFAAQLEGLKRALRPLSAADRFNGPSRALASAARVTAPPVARKPAAEAGPQSISPWLRTPRQRALADAIAHAAETVGVSSDVSLAVAVAESSLDPTARSSDGLSSGTFQVTGPTQKDIRRRIREGELVRPPGSDDVALGIAHLGWLHDLFGRDATLGGSLRTVPVANSGERTRFAVAAYNAGEGRVARAQERAAAQRRDPTRYENIRAFLPEITQRYVDRVMRYSGGATSSVRAA